MGNFFWSNIFGQGNSECQNIAQLWQKTPLFTDIPIKQIEFLAAKMHIRCFDAEEVIFHQGDQGAGAVLVLEGGVRIMTSKVELASLRTGDFFGELALAETDHRAADAFAIDDSRLVFFLKQDLEEWIEYEPRHGARLLTNLSSILAQRLYQANKVIAAKQT